MSAKVAAVLAGLFALAEAVLLALFLLTGDESRFIVQVMHVACVAIFAGLAAVVLLVPSWRKTVVPHSSERGLWRVLGVAAALAWAGHGLQFGGLLMAGPEPLNGWQVAGHIGQEVGLVVVAGSAALTLWQSARQPSPVAAG